MNLLKAIEINDTHQSDMSREVLPDLIDAIKLGIEAMKRTQTRRENLSWKFEPLLPGETEE